MLRKHIIESSILSLMFIIAFTFARDVEIVVVLLFLFTLYGWLMTALYLIANKGVHIDMVRAKFITLLSFPECKRGVEIHFLDDYWTYTSFKCLEHFDRERQKWPDLDFKAHMKDDEVFRIDVFSPKNIEAKAAKLI